MKYIPCTVVRIRSIRQKDTHSHKLGFQRRKNKKYKIAMGKENGKEKQTKETVKPDAATESQRCSCAVLFISWVEPCHGPHDATGFCYACGRYVLPSGERTASTQTLLPPCKVKAAHMCWRCIFQDPDSSCSNEAGSDVKKGMLA